MSPIITPLTPEQVTEQEAKTAKEGYVKGVLIGLDEFGDTLIAGHPGETISSRAARAATQGKMWGKALSRFLNLFEKNHGAKAEAADLERAKEVEYLEENSGTLPKNLKPPTPFIVIGGDNNGDATVNNYTTK